MKMSGEVERGRNERSPKRRSCDVEVRKLDWNEAIVLMERNFQLRVCFIINNFHLGLALLKCSTKDLGYFMSK